MKKHSTNVNESDNVTLTCEANESVYWLDISDKFPLLWTITFAWDRDISFFYMTAAKFHDGKYKLHTEYNNGGKHIATLDLFNVNHRSVGRYYCIKYSAHFSDPMDLLEENSINFSSIQLFVNGEFP